MNCLRSSASPLNLVSQDAIMGELTQLPNLQDISDSYAPPWVISDQELHASLSNCWRQDPLCCQQGNGHGPTSVNSTNNSSELSHLFPEQTIYFNFSCYVSALEYNLPSASHEAGRNIVVDRRPLKLDFSFAPHQSDISYVMEAMGSNREKHPFGSIQQTVDMTRSRSVEFLIRQREVKDYVVRWCSGHGSARFNVEKLSIDTAEMPKASGTYNTRRSAAAKRKR